jgi:RNA polymerase sigma-70 factor, ECF subfamily
LNVDGLPVALADDLDGSFERLVLTYQDRLYAFALYLCGSPRDAEEAVQDAFVRAYRALARYPAERVRDLHLRAWLYQITKNVVRNRVRGRRLQLVPPDGGHAEPEDDEMERPEAAFERREQRGELGALVARLPERYRAAVVLRHVQALSYAEVAAILGQPIGTVKANVHRGVRLLRAALERQERTLGPDCRTVQGDGAKMAKPGRRGPR